MRDRLISYVKELTLNKPGGEEYRSRALDIYDGEIAKGTAPEAAMGLAIASLGAPLVPAEPSPEAKPGQSSRGRDFTIGDNRWKIRGEVRAIRVNYSYGKVFLRQHSGTDTVVFEKNLGETAEPARFTFEKGILAIDFNGKKTVRRSLEGIKDVFAPQRCLEILVPARMASGLMEIKLASQSADFSVTNLSAEVFECETASGDASVAYCAFESAIFSSSGGEWSSKYTDIGDLDLDTSGGDCDVRGGVKRISFESASGDLHAVFAYAPEELSFSSASGVCKLYLPESASFTLNLKTVSGRAKVEGFDGFYLGSGAERKYICGKSGGEYTISTASGNVGVYVNRGIR